MDRQADAGAGARIGLVRLLVVVLGLVLGCTVRALALHRRDGPVPERAGEGRLRPGRLARDRPRGPGADRRLHQRPVRAGLPVQRPRRSATTAPPAASRCCATATARAHLCAFYDSTLLFPKDVLFNPVTGLGTVVLDMDDPAKPGRPPPLTSPAMLSPHESLLLNTKRGILAAVLGNPATNVSVLDLYDVRELPPPAAALEHADRRARPRERLRARRQDVLHHRRGGEHVRRPSTSATRPPRR